MKHLKLLSIVVGILILVITMQACRENMKGDDQEFSQTQEASVAAGEAENSARIWFEPMDLSTSCASTPPSIGFETEDQEPGLDGLNALSESMGLWTWPEMEKVLGTVELEGWVGLDYPSVNHARLVFKPASPLADRWYILGVSNPPSPLLVEKGVAHVTLPEGGLGARFKTGSQFLVREYRLCGPVGEPTIKIRFSEPVERSISSTAVMVKRDGEPNIYCTRIPDADDTTPLATELAVFCNSLKFPAIMMIDRQVKSLEGKPLTDIWGNEGDQSFALTLQEELTDSIGCRVFFNEI